MLQNFLISILYQILFFSWSTLKKFTLITQRRGRQIVFCVRGFLRFSYQLKTNYRKSSWLARLERTRRGFTWATFRPTSDPRILKTSSTNMAKSSSSTSRIAGTVPNLIVKFRIYRFWNSWMYVFLIYLILFSLTFIIFKLCKP